MKIFKIFLFSLLLGFQAHAQSYSPMSWGLNKGVTPYSFGTNINGSWYDLGTISSTGVWSIPGTNSSFISAGGGSIPTTVSARLQQNISAKDFATGNTLNYIDGAMSSGSSVLTSASATFTAADVGKYVLVQKSGVGGISSKGTITGFTNSHSVTVSFSSSANITNANFIYGSDDTAGIQNAVNYAAATGSCVNFPAGGYWLATQTVSINLTYVCLQGVGSTEFQNPYVGRGSTIIITQTAVTPFTISIGVDISGMQFYYPAQDASQATPIVYPPLFTANTLGNVTFVNNVFINPYDLFYVPVETGWGRFTLSNNKAYCVRYCFNALTGNGDEFELDSNNIFSPGVYQDYALYTNGGVLGAWTGDNGEFVHFDGTGSSFQSFSINMNAGLVFGYRYGIRMVNSGNMYVSTVQNVAWDAVATVLSFEGGTYPSQLRLSGGYVYSYRGIAPDGPSVYDDVISLTSTCSGPSVGVGVLSINDISFYSSKGNILNLQTNCLISAPVKDNYFQAWGQSTTTGGAYYAMISFVPLDVTGNTYIGYSVPGSEMRAILSYNGGNISGNSFKNSRPIYYLGLNTLNVVGNTSVNSVVSDVYNGSTGIVAQNANNWSLDAPFQSYVNTLIVPQSLPSVSSCGTSPPGLEAGSNNNSGRFIMGTGSPSSCTVSFSSAYPNTAHCTISPSNGYTGTYYISTQSRVGFIVTLGTGTNNAAFNYTCFGN